MRRNDNAVGDCKCDQFYQVDHDTDATTPLRSETLDEKR